MNQNKNGIKEKIKDVKTSAYSGESTSYICKEPLKQVIQISMERRRKKWL